jgi:hypothetical protein
VCEAIGEDFRFNPTFLRVPLAASVLYSPMWSVIVYFALGAIVLASRVLFPKAKLAAPLTHVEEAPAAVAPEQEWQKAA